jgi:hypothetical protein
MEKICKDTVKELERYYDKSGLKWITTIIKLLEVFDDVFKELPEILDDIGHEIETLDKAAEAFNEGELYIPGLNTQADLNTRLLKCDSIGECEQLLPLYATYMVAKAAELKVHWFLSVENRQGLRASPGGWRIEEKIKKLMTKITLKEGKK